MGTGARASASSVQWEFLSIHGTGGGNEGEEAADGRSRFWKTCWMKPQKTGEKPEVRKGGFVRGLSRWGNFKMISLQKRRDELRRAAAPREKYLMFER